MAKKKPKSEPDLLDQAEAAGEQIEYKAGDANGESAKPKRERKESDGGRIVRDKELVAMQDVADLLDGLDEKMRSRVVLWTMQRYGNLMFAGALAKVDVTNRPE